MSDIDHQIAVITSELQVLTLEIQALDRQLAAAVLANQAHLHLVTQLSEKTAKQESLERSLPALRAQAVIEHRDHALAMEIAVLTAGDADLRKKLTAVAAELSNNQQTLAEGYAQLRRVAREHKDERENKLAAEQIAKEAEEVANAIASVAAAEGHDTKFDLSWFFPDRFALQPQTQQQQQTEEIEIEDALTGLFDDDGNLRYKAADTNEFDLDEFAQKSQADSDSDSDSDDGVLQEAKLPEPVPRDDLPRTIDAFVKHFQQKNGYADVGPATTIQTTDMYSTTRTVYADGSVSYSGISVGARDTPLSQCSTNWCFLVSLFTLNTNFFMDLGIQSPWAMAQALEQRGVQVARNTMFATDGSPNLISEVARCFNVQIAVSAFANSEYKGLVNVGWNATTLHVCIDLGKHHYVSGTEDNRALQLADTDLELAMRLAMSMSMSMSR